MDDSFEDTGVRNNEESNLLKKYDAEYLIEKSGGWGRMQLICFIFTIIAYQGPNYYAYCLAYLELVPRLLCGVEGGELHECGKYSFAYENQTYFLGEEEYRSELCDGNKIRSDIYFEVDYNDSESYHNWMTDEQLYCKSKFMIGLFGSLFFLGFAISGLMLKFSDTVGRVRIVRFGLFLQV